MGTVSRQIGYHNNVINENGSVWCGSTLSTSLLVCLQQAQFFYCLLSVYAALEKSFLILSLAITLSLLIDITFLAITLSLPCYHSLSSLVSPYLFLAFYHTLSSLVSPSLFLAITSLFLSITLSLPCYHTLSCYHHGNHVVYDCICPIP